MSDTEGDSTYHLRSGKGSPRPDGVLTSAHATSVGKVPVLRKSDTVDDLLVSVELEEQTPLDEIPDARIDEVTSRIVTRPSEQETVEIASFSSAM